jgi:uncharacterized membrane protein YfcA
MSIAEILLLIVAGLMVGFINTLAGGGSIISLSVLMTVFQLPAPVANGTNRVAILLQTLTASGSFLKQKTLDWRKGLKLGIPSAMGAFVGALIAVKIDEALFEKMIAVILLFMLIFIFYKPKRWLVGNEELMKKDVSIWQMLLFFAIGIYGGFLHAGIGYFLLASIVLGAGYDLVKANAIKVFIVFLYAPVALGVYMYYDQVIWKYGLILAIGNVLGAIIASKLAVQKGASFVRWVILVVVILTASHLFGFIDISSIFHNFEAYQ